MVVKGSTNRVLRSFAVTEDFEPGGIPVHFASMDSDTRSAMEEVWKQLDGAYQADFNPINAVFGLYKSRKLAGASGWANNGDQIFMKHQFMIDRACEPGGLQGTYDWLDGDWRKVCRKGSTDEVEFGSGASNLPSDIPPRINNYEADMTKHPWALKTIYRTMITKSGSSKSQLEGVSLLVEWQECEPASIDTLAQTSVVHGLNQLQVASDTDLDAPA
ncbi:hypothetical protein FRC17_009791 [Serendipita sp. 399]|nr:hypothetical protein FRC17_009791 [Serendipita sp. 399]